MDDTPLSRRATLTILGTATLGAYAAPAFATLSMARASDASAASTQSIVAPGSDPSPLSASYTDPSACSSPTGSACAAI